MPANDTNVHLTTSHHIPDVAVHVVLIPDIGDVSLAANLCHTLFNNPDVPAPDRPERRDLGT